MASLIQLAFDFFQTSEAAPAPAPRVRRVRRFTMANTRPGVPDTMCTPASSLRMSSPMDLPPTHACACTFMKSPSASTTFSVCSASSRVGDSTSACTLRTAETPA